MELLVNSRQMKACDRAAIEEYQIPSLVLMERAALCLAGEIRDCLEKGSDTANGRRPRILIVCGNGNNGADGLAAGRILRQGSYEICLVMPFRETHISEEAAAQLRILKAMEIPVELRIPDKSFDVIVDALFGIGLSRNLEGAYLDLIRQMNKLNGIKIAADIPSGIHGDTGEIMGEAFRADQTVTFAFRKTGLLLYPGASYAGVVSCHEIGIDDHGFPEKEPRTYRMNAADLGRIPPRSPWSNKGTYGKVLTAAGCRNMAGAAFLSAKASYLTGAGLVKIFTEESNRVILQQLLPEAVLDTYEPKEPQSLPQRLEKYMDQADVLVAGPGLGTGRAAKQLVEFVTAHADIPVILDADALNLLSRNREWLTAGPAGAPRILTPHLGEMARLVDKEISCIQTHILETAREFARTYQVICVLKDARTVTALPNGMAWVNTSGTNGMATAGAGDVLTGILAGLIAQGMRPEEAAPLGVYLHGAAAQSMLRETGAYGMTAQDILRGIVQVMPREQS